MPETPTIFVIDDDEVVRDSLKALLETRQFAVEEFTSAADFLARRDHHASACLILDVHMPEMSGTELLRRLRAQGDRIPTVLITGRRDRAAEEQAKALGVVALLDKPVAHRVLFQAIETALRNNP
jgi:two-component system, LuxR family, response regulator FixJ